MYRNIIKIQRNTDFSFLLVTKTLEMDENPELKLSKDN